MTQPRLAPDIGRMVPCDPIDPRADSGDGLIQACAAYAPDLRAPHASGETLKPRQAGGAPGRKGLPAAADQVDCSLLSHPRSVQAGEHFARGACPLVRRLVNGHAEVELPRLQVRPY